MSESRRNRFGITCPQLLQQAQSCLDLKLDEERYKKVRTIFQISVPKEWSSKEFLIIPTVLNQHFFLIILENPNGFVLGKSVNLYSMDSLERNHDDHMDIIGEIFQLLLEAEAHKEAQTRDYKHEIRKFRVKVSRQQNGYDCGLFCVYFARRFMENSELVMKEIIEKSCDEPGSQLFVDRNRSSQFRQELEGILIESAEAAARGR
jgi:Ulp1 family protease